MTILIYDKEILVGWFEFDDYNMGFSRIVAQTIEEFKQNNPNESVSYFMVSAMMVGKGYINDFKPVPYDADDIIRL